jgi:hypothetical protein
MSVLCRFHVGFVSVVSVSGFKTHVNRVGGQGVSGGVPIGVHVLPVRDVVLQLRGGWGGFGPHRRWAVVGSSGSAKPTRL